MNSRIARYKYRAYPTKQQELYLAGLFGATRAVYNSYIWEREQLFKNGVTTETPNQTISRLTCFKTLPTDKDWLKQYPSWTIQNSALTAKRAYEAFFKGLAGKRKNKVGKPVYKKKKLGGSAVFLPAEPYKLNNKYSAVKLSKCGRIKFRYTRELPSSPSSITLSKDKVGRYWISFVIEQTIASPKQSGSAAGIDVGLTDLITVAQTDRTRYKVPSPRFYRQAEKKLSRLQRDFSRKQKGSANQEKARLKLAKQHQKVANTRKDFLEKLAFKLCSENQAVCLESLSVKSMLKNRSLAKSISDASWGILNTAIENQAQKQGVEVLRCGRFTPTSQVCSKCWLSSGKKPLSVRTWTCDCGAVLDRDYNAAVNILLAARHADTINDCGPEVRLQLAEAHWSEAVTSSLDSSNSF